MSENKLVFFKNPPSHSTELASVENTQRLEPSTCVEAETFVLQVLDDSMEPEFKRKCMIVIDPTGHAKDGSYVFARRTNAFNVEERQHNTHDAVDDYQFRQLKQCSDDTWQLRPLNDNYPSVSTPSNFSEIVGVIVQRAGTRRRYHKRYD